jgi:hypothetical protein
MEELSRRIANCGSTNKGLAMNKFPPHHDYCESNIEKAVFIETKVGKGRNKAAILI